MNRAGLLSTVAATLLLSGGAALAQNPKDANPAPAPAAQQNAPPEKVAPNMKAGTPQAETHKASAGGASAGGAAAADGGLKPSDANGSSANKPGAAQNSVPNAAPNASPKSGENEPHSTTGQGVAAGAAKLSTEQRGQITSVFKQHRVEPAHLSISVSVGMRLPETVHYYPVPEDVVVIYPEWRGYDYIIVGNEIVVLDPRTHEIVAILEA